MTGSYRACQTGKSQLRKQNGKIRSNGVFRPHCCCFGKKRIKVVGWRGVKLLVSLDLAVFADFRVREGESFIRSNGKSGQCGRTFAFPSFPQAPWSLSPQLRIPLHPQQLDILNLTQPSRKKHLTTLAGCAYNKTNFRGARGAG